MKIRRILLVLAASVIGIVIVFIATLSGNRQAQSNLAAGGNEFIFVAEKAYASGDRNLHYEEALAEIRSSGALTVFVPLIVTDTTTQFITVPLTSKKIGSWGYTHQEALTGNFFGQGLNQVAVSVMPAESGQYYIMERTFIELAIPDLPDGVEIKEVNLVIDSCGSTVEMSPGTIVINPGTWSGVLPDDNELWNSFDESFVVATFIEDTSCPPQIRKITFDPHFFAPGQTIKVVIRDSQDTTDLRAIYDSPTARRGMRSHPYFTVEHWELFLEYDFPEW